MPEHDDFAKIRQLMEDAGLRPFAYSGRGMFGRRCLAVTLDRSEGQSEWDAAMVLAIAAVAAGLSVEDLEDHHDFLRCPETDSLGRDRVLYWPRLMWPEGLDPHAG